MGALQAEVRLHLQTVSPRNWYSPFLCLLGCSKIVLIETYLKRRGGRERSVCPGENTGFSQVDVGKEGKRQRGRAGFRRRTGPVPARLCSFTGTESCPRWTRVRFLAPRSVPRALTGVIPWPCQGITKNLIK